MSYTIIECLGTLGPSGKRIIGTYDCAYEAVNAFRAALQVENDAVWSWYLVDNVGTVLFDPTDLTAIVAESDEFRATRFARPSGAQRSNRERQADRKPGNLESRSLIPPVEPAL